MIPTNTLSLVVKDPGDATPHEGVWRIELLTAGGDAVNDDGDGLAGNRFVHTTPVVLDENGAYVSGGVAEIELPDTTHADYDPQGAFYRAHFSGGIPARSVRRKSEPFLMDGPKRYRDIFTVTAAPVTPSLAAQAEAARDAAQGYAETAETAAGTVADSIEILQGIDVDEVATSAATATTKASEAATSATNAATSASAASSSATTADTSAASATTAASAAAISAGAAEDAADTAVAVLDQLDVLKVRSWYANLGVLPPRGPEPGGRLWVVPMSFMADLDTYVPEHVPGIDQFDAGVGD